MRQHIGAVMKRALAHGYRDDYPAGDAVSAALPKIAVHQQHMRAPPHAEVGATLARVRGSGAYLGTMLAFEFLVLTAARSGEVRNARWEQGDRAGTVWTIPAERMKTGREHRAPVSPRALEVLDGTAQLFDGEGLVFPSPAGRMLNHATLTARNGPVVGACTAGHRRKPVPYTCYTLMNASAQSRGGEPSANRTSSIASSRRCMRRCSAMPTGAIPRP